jgi:hypothetical protein
MTSLQKDLCDEIETKNVLIVVGAGVSIAATNSPPAASWTGLLKRDVCSNYSKLLPMTSVGLFERLLVTSLPHKETAVEKGPNTYLILRLQ